MSEDFDTQQQERPAQQQDRQPGRESQMAPQPVIIRDEYRPAGRLSPGEIVGSVGQ